MGSIRARYCVFIVYCLVVGVNVACYALSSSNGPNGGAEPIWSPDGSRLAFLSGTPNTPLDTWVVDVGDGSAPRQLTRRGARVTGWSEDGGEIYCHTMRGGTSSFYSVGVDLGGETQLLNFLPGDVERIAWAPDEESLAYLAPHEDHHDIWVSGREGTDRRKLTEGLHVRSMAWAPDGSAIAFDTGGVYGRATYVVDVGGGREPELVFGGVGSDPSWSPDGRRLALVGMHTLTVLSLGPEERAAERLHVSQSNRTSVDWSSDGRRIAFTSWDAEGFGISAVEVASGEVTTFSSGYVVAGSPRWSPDGRLLAFQARSRGDCADNIFVLDTQEQAGGARQLTSAAPSYWDVTWIEGGASLLFSSNAAGDKAFRLYRSSPPGAESSALLAFDPRRPPRVSWPPGSDTGIIVVHKKVWQLASSGEPTLLVETEHPTWADVSPDGTSFAYVKWQEHKASIVMRSFEDGTEQELLPPPGAGLAYSKISWSPSGEELAFVREQAVCLVSRETREARVLSEAVEDAAGTTTLPPRWSPDGRWIAFGRFSRAKGQRLQVLVVRADEPEDVHVVGSSSLESEAGAYGDPLSLPYAWSPDGQQLAFCLEEDHRPALYVVEIDGAGPASPALLRTEAAFPAWAGKGRQIGFTALDGNREALRLYDLEDGSERSLGPHPDVSAGVSTEGAR